MRITNYPGFLMSALLVIFLCAGCSGKKEDEAAPIQINPEKDIHELYKKVVKDRKKNSCQSRTRIKRKRSAEGKTGRCC